MPQPWTALDPLARGDYVALRRRLVFDFGKWDPQNEDGDVIAPFAIALEPPAWGRIASAAEQLAAEAAAAERALLMRPRLHRLLGLPRRVRAALRAAAQSGLPLSAPRCIRFDFHLAREGWRISEANTDVPGGLIEATGLAALMAEAYPDVMLPGDPTAALADALAGTVHAGSDIALVHATAYSDDRQVMVHLGRALAARACTPHLVAPDHLHWTDGRPHMSTRWRRGPIDAVARFFPAEWLPNLGRQCAWRSFFAAGVPLTNPATAILVQSKRFPLVWDDLGLALPSWRALLPETRDPRDAPWRSSGDWVLKPALGRVGDGIGIRGVTDQRDWRRISRAARFSPRSWAAQRRFEAVPIDTPLGPRFPCIGVFVIDGRVAGAYGRLAARPLIDARSQDVAVLVQARVGAELPGEPCVQAAAV